MNFLTKETLQLLSHLTAKQAAETLGVSLGTIYVVAKAYGISFSKNRPTKEELQKHIHLNANEIAEIYKVTPATIRIWAKFYDLKLTRKEAEVKIKPSKEELEKLTHLSQKQIAQFYGVTKQYVSLWGKEYGITFLPTKGKIKKKPMPSKEEIEGLTMNQVVEKYKVSVSTAGKWRKELGLGSKRPTKEELEKLSHLKQKEIGQILGVSQTLVSYLMRKYGISKKSLKEEVKKAILEKLQKDTSC